MLTKTVNYAGDLAFGLGPFRSSLETVEEKEQLADQVSDHIGEVTDPGVVDCMDDRGILAFGDGTTDEASLLHRVVYQGPGGTILSFTKAAVAANLAIVAEATDFTHAYVIMFNFLTSPERGWSDSGHADCGAAKKAVDSVAEPVERGLLLPTLHQILEVDESSKAGFNRTHAQVAAQKQARLEAGFYRSWSSEWHETHLSQRVPQNFATLEKVHRPEGFALLRTDGYGYRKNQAIADTGKRVFVATTTQWDQVIQHTCVTTEEKQRMKIALADDLCNVSNRLIAPGMPLFAETTELIAARN